MTSNESFKKRVRERMAHTGERYNAARRVLLDRSTPAAGRTWVSDPEMDDDAITAATGRGWDAWCDAVDASGIDTRDHGAIASFVFEHAAEVGPPLTHWWSQAVAVGYERIAGLRLPNQRADGTFTASRSRTLPVTPETVRELLLDDDARADLFPGLDAELRSKPTTKVLRYAVEGGVVLFTVDPAGEGRARVTVTHERLPGVEDLGRWKAYWGEWLEALVDAA